jgi:tetratricopeptide (TPR) repeat protein
MTGLAFRAVPGFAGPMRLITLSMAIVMFSAGPLLAAKSSSFEDMSSDSKDRYERCVELTKTNAQAAYREASGWHSAPGEHCLALALVQLKRFGEAARTLDSLASGASLNGRERAQIYDQAGNVWILAGQARNAVLSLSSALSLSGDADFLSDRARARAMLKDWVGADADLSAALAKDSNRADLFVLRGSARHAQGRKAEARADIDKALSLYPNYPDALVERGAMKYENADKVGARADWQLAVKLAGNTAAGQSARNYLGEMEAPPTKP